jgi:hypothetical protein
MPKKHVRKRAVTRALVVTIVKLGLLSPRLEPFVLLFLARVPSKLSADAIHPVLASPARRHHRCKWESASTDCHVVSGEQLDALSSVEACPRVCSSIVWHADPQDNRVWQNDGSERQRVCAYGSHQHHGIFWMTERPTRRQVVGS